MRSCIVVALSAIVALSLLNTRSLADDHTKLAAPKDLAKRELKNLPDGSAVLEALGTGTGPNSEYNYDNNDWGTLNVFVGSDGSVTVELSAKTAMIGKIGDRSLTRNLAAYRGEQEPKSGRYNRIANVIFDSTRSARDLILVCGAICNCEMWRIRILVQGPGGKRYLVPFNAPGWVETPFGDSKKIKQPDAPKDKLPTPRRNVRFEGPPSLDDPPPEKPVEYPGGEDTDPKKDKEKEKEGPKIEAGALPIYIHAYAAKDKAGKQTVVYIAECDEKKTDHHVDIPEEVTITDPIFLAGHSDIGFGGVGDPGRVAAIEKAKTWAKELNSNEMRLEVIDGVTLDGLLEVVTAAYGSDAALVVLLR